MSFLGERVAYLKGLAEGLKVDESSNEGKLIKGIIDVLEDFALEVEDLEDSIDNMAEHIEEVDDDLAQLEDDYYEYDDEDFDEEVEYEVECPSCNEIITIKEDDLGDIIYCPNCDTEIEVEEECECGCE
jgi:chromosome segregation ATPase